VNKGSAQSGLDTAPDTPGTSRNELVKKPNVSAPFAESGSGIPLITSTRRCAVRRLETLRKFLVNFFGFPALYVRRCLQAAFHFVGKGHQRKRHGKPRHRKPESAASGTRQPSSLALPFKIHVVF